VFLSMDRLLELLLKKLARGNTLDLFDYAVREEKVVKLCNTVTRSDGPSSTSRLSSKLGEATYIDDIPKRSDELYLAFVLSSRAHARDQCHKNLQPKIIKVRIKLESLPLGDLSCVV